MRTLSRTVRAAAWAALWMLMPSVLWAQGTSPWVDAVNELQTQFTGPIARGLSLIAIVVGGLMFAFGEGGSKRTLAGIIFGIGMAVGAVNSADRRGTRCPSRGGAPESRYRGQASATRPKGSHCLREPLARPRLVEQGCGSRRAGTQAWAWLALPEGPPKPPEGPFPSHLAGTNSGNPTIEIP